MPNAKVHRVGAGAIIGSGLLLQDLDKGIVTVRPLLGALGGAAFGTLPDLLEPATNPNHRKLFHSVGMFGLVGLGLYKLDQWEPEDDFDKVLKAVSMVAASAYLIHLAMDSTTPKSLPII